MKLISTGKNYERSKYYSGGDTGSYSGGDTGGSAPSGGDGGGDGGGGGMGGYAVREPREARELYPVTRWIYRYVGIRD